MEDKGEEEDEGGEAVDVMMESRETGDVEITDAAMASAFAFL